MAKSNFSPRYGLMTSEERGIRYLHFDSPWVQGAMRVSNPNKLELEYTRWLMCGLLMQEDYTWPRRVLLIGLGAGSIAKFCLAHLPNAQIDVVELDPRIPGYAAHFFGLPADKPKLNITIGDGVTFIESLAAKSSRRSSYDLIIVDGFDDNASAGGLDAVEFYRNCAQALSVDGVITVNLFSRGKRHVNGVARLEKAFAQVRALPTCESGNVVVMACAEKVVLPTAGAAGQRARQLREATGLSLLPIAKYLAGK